jgi:hypothetical protein
MSAFIVADTTINRVIDSLVCDRRREFEWYKKAILTAAQIDLFDADWTTKLGVSMAGMNDAAMDSRYSEGTAAGDRAGKAYEYHMVHPDSLIQVYKSLGCYLYQCSEGDVPEVFALYKALEDYKHTLADHIISALPAYDRAEWA